MVLMQSCSGSSLIILLSWIAEMVHAWISVSWLLELLNILRLDVGLLIAWFLLRLKVSVFI